MLLRGPVARWSSPPVFWDENKSGSENLFAAAVCKFPADVYGVGEGVAEGSTVGLGVADSEGVGVGETSVPGVGVGSAE
jgi:hypothetical protein